MKDIKKLIIGIAIGAIVTGGICAIFWPKRVAKLKNGSEVVVEVKGKKITADELYSNLKESYGINTVFNILDEYILKDKYDLGKEASEYVKEQSESLYSSYQEYYQMSKEEFLSGNGFGSEEDFLRVLENEYYSDYHTKEYIKSSLKEKDYKEYYNTRVFGDKKLYVITAQTEDTLKNVAAELKKGNNLDNISKEITDFNTDNYNNFTYENKDNVTDLTLSAIAQTSKGNVSKIYTSENGFYMVYVVSEKEKPAYKDVKDKIIDLIVTKKIKENSEIGFEAIVMLRKEYGIKFYDKEIEKSYVTIKEN